MFNCCKDLIDCIERKELKLYPKYRGVCYYIKREGEKEYGQYFMYYCPFCGAKLPKVFDDEYCDALEEAVGKEFCDIKEDEIPPEFQTDEWWKKRGL